MSNLNQTQVRPPVSDPIIPPTTQSNGMLTPIWLRFFNNFYQLISTTLQAGNSIPNLTTSQRDANPQYKNQVFIWNTTANELQIYLDGAWQKITYTAA